MSGVGVRTLIMSYVSLYNGVSRLKNIRKYDCTILFHDNYTNEIQIVYRN